MGPLLGRLPPGAPAGKALGEMARGETSFNTPGSRNGCKRLKHETAICEVGMGNDEAARSELAAAPQCNVEIEHAWTPAAAAPPAEISLDPFEALEHLGWLEFALDEGDGVREIATRSA